MSGNNFCAGMMKEESYCLILNGPNLNMLGTRETSIYGTLSLERIEEECRKRANFLGLGIDFYQSNEEGTLISWIHRSTEKYGGIIINGGALSHTSIALLDALLLTSLPVIEVHLSNIFRRESFRHHSYLSLSSVGVICGFGLQSYLLALDGMAFLLNKKSFHDQI